MVALSLTRPLLPQKPKCKCGYPGNHHVGKDWYCDECYTNGNDEKTEKTYDPFRASNNVLYDFRTHLRNIMLRAQR